MLDILIQIVYMRIIMGQGVLKLTHHSDTRSPLSGMAPYALG